ncbi:hypothetical protein KSP40_PGU016985 [Platanthera guangdongensis]|uniref:Uncharacterized protein n=1 Tax=Platanthera guangdongensis TaxID=2320717 RepID=A0ABR2LRV7_9ASPA
MRAGEGTGREETVGVDYYWNGEFHRLCSAPWSSPDDSVDPEKRWRQWRDFAAVLILGGTAMRLDLEERLERRSDLVKRWRGVDPGGSRGVHCSRSRAAEVLKVETKAVQAGIESSRGFVIGNNDLDVERCSWNLCRALGEMLSPGVRETMDVGLKTPGAVLGVTLPLAAYFLAINRAQAAYFPHFYFDVVLLLRFPAISSSCCSESTSSSSTSSPSFYVPLAGGARSSSLCRHRLLLLLHPPPGFLLLFLADYFPAPLFFFFLELGCRETALPLPSFCSAAVDCFSAAAIVLCLMLHREQLSAADFGVSSATACICVVVEPPQGVRWLVADVWWGLCLTVAGMIRGQSSDNGKGGGHAIPMSCFSISKVWFHEGHDSMQHVESNP